MSDSKSTSDQIAKINKKVNKAVAKRYKRTKENKDKKFEIAAIDESLLQTFIVRFELAGSQHLLSIKTEHAGNKFPFQAPYVKFLTSVFHPNVSTSGSICVDILKTDKWSPSYGFEAIVSSIMLLFDNPNPSSPLNSAAAQVYKMCMCKYKKYMFDKKIKSDSVNMKDGFLEPFIKINKDLDKQNVPVLSKYASLFGVQ
jgi:ubiquitin-protein ligase